MAITAAQLMVRIGADTSGAERGMQAVQQKAKGLGAGLGGIAKVAGGAVAALGGIALAGKAFAGAKTAVVDFNASMEQSRIAWETMLKSGEAADQMLADLQRFAKETPFDFPGLEESSRRLLAMGFSASEVIPMMETLGDAASALGLGSEGVNRLGLALGQMQAKTKVSGEEMRQLTEAGVPAWDILAQAVGKPIPEVMKLSEAGKIASDTFIEAFRTFSEQNYGGMMERQAQTFSGAMSNIKDSLTQGAAAAFQPLFAKLSEAAQHIAAFVSSADFSEFARRISVMVDKTLNVLSALGDAWGKAMARLSGITSGAGESIQKAWAGVVGWFAEQMPKVQQIVQTALGAVQQLWDEYGQRILGVLRNVGGILQTAIQTLMANIGEILNLALSLIQGDWEGAWNSLKTILANTWQGILRVLGNAAKGVLGIVGSIFQAIGAEDPTAGWSDSIDQWVNSLGSASEKVLGVKSSVGQAAGATKSWNDYVREGTSILGGWGLGLADVKGELDALSASSRSTGAAAASIAPPMNTAAMAMDSIGDSAAGATQDVGGLVAALVRIHPASVAAAQAVTAWEVQIDAVNAALQANQRRQRDMQAEIARTQERISGLNERLNEARQRLQELSTPRLTGMGQIDMQIQALQDHLKRVELAKTLGQPLEDIIARYPLLTAGAEEFVRQLPTGEKALQEQLRAMELMRSLQYDERLRLLQAQATPPSSEIGYDAARQAIADTQNEIGRLTSALTMQETRLAKQQASLAKVAAEAERLNDALQGYQAQLQAAQQAQTLVNQGLEMAYNWFLKDREEMLALGGEAAAQVAVIDAQARALLMETSTFASDTSTLTTATLQSMITGLETRTAEAIVKINAELDSLQRTVVTTHVIRTVYETAGSSAAIPGRALGGPVWPRQAYIVGENGPELFVPDVSGQIVANRGTGRGSAASAGGVVIEKLIVEGSVITEKELTESVYEGLLRLRRRNGAVGLA